MNLLKLCSAAAFAFLLVSGDGFAAHPAYKLRVQGMVCKLCAASLQARLKEEIRGVEQVNVDLATGTVVITTAEGASIDAEAARRTVHGAGFRLLGFEAVPAGRWVIPR
jgi:copper chaperone CopZ